MGSEDILDGLPKFKGLFEKENVVLKLRLEGGLSWGLGFAFSGMVRIKSSQR